MKSTKQFLSLALLLGAVNVFAGQINLNSKHQGTPQKLFQCKSKINATLVDTEQLFVGKCAAICGDLITKGNLSVGKSATICGDLAVKGNIYNLKLKLLEDSAVPPTDEVYNEIFTVPSSQPILENIEEFEVPRNINVPGTEIYPNAPIYGYNQNQTLDLLGGPEKSYTSVFEGVGVKYHGQNPTQLALTTRENMQSWHERAISFYFQRGLPLPIIDVYPQYEGQFILNNEKGFFAIKFHFEQGPIPTALDLISINAPLFTAIDLFEPNPSLRKNGRYYPIRIPITSDFAVFNQSFGKKPSVYYDNSHRKITIHVPELNGTVYELSSFNLFIPESGCNVGISYTDNLVAFDGTFSLMRRNEINQLVSSSFDQLEYIIQASETVRLVSLFVDAGTPEILVEEFQFNTPGGVFSGLAIPLMNGGSPISDVYTYNIDQSNATSMLTDPLILPALPGTFFQEGDNIATTLIEKYGSSSTNSYFDSTKWFSASVGLPGIVMEGLTYPEENPFVPLPELVNPKRTLTGLVGHEMMHNAHTLSGVSRFIPTEGQATGLEMDPRLNDNVYLTFRAADWGKAYMPTVIRGDWPLTAPEINAPTSTYGSSIFWKYIATQFDYNYQAMRRMSDIITHETFGPLLEENNVPFASAVLLGVSGSLGHNPAGSLLALAQAMDELHGINVQDVFSDYAISLAMLRNNTSIPEQYRHAYPYWLASPTYEGYQELAFQAETWATWWQDYQDNIVMPPDYSLPKYENQRFVPILNQNVINKETQDMTMLIFEVPANTAAVTVNVAEGEWSVSMLQFTSDGTPEGEFLIDGPHANNGGQTVFDVSQFTGAGSIRLVCANVGIHDYQGLNNWCGREPIYTGKISILRS